MEKHNKDLKKIIVKKDSLHATLMQTYANYWKLKIEKDSLDSLSVEHNKLQKDYKNMEQILLKQQKELHELKVNIGNVHHSKNELQRQYN